MRLGPIADLPARVSFELAEVARILFAIDLAVERTQPGSGEHGSARAAQQLVTSRLWPELGELLGNGGERGE